MKAMFVNSNGGIPYARLITSGLKKIETRNRDMLRELCGERVAVVYTRRGKNPLVIGAVDVTGKYFAGVEQFKAERNLHFVPEGSMYDATGRGKWCYTLENAAVCDPFPLPDSAVRHGRSWCEF